MSKLLAVAARELRERWLLFPGALVAGLFPLVLPAFGVRRERRADGGLVTSVLLGAAAAVVIGSTMLARDSSNGRLGFLFSRPAVLGGPSGAASGWRPSSSRRRAPPWPRSRGWLAYPLESLGGHHGDSWLRAMLDGPGDAALPRPARPRVGLANFNATAFRSRSPWLALDLVLLLLAGWAIRRYVAPLVSLGILAIDRRSGWRLLAPLGPLAVGLLLGSVAQVALRPDRPAPGAPRDVARLLGRGRRAGRRRRATGLGPVGAPRRRARCRSRPATRRALGLRRGFWRLAARRLARAPDRHDDRALRATWAARRLVAGPRGLAVLGGRRFAAQSRGAPPTGARARSCSSTSPARHPRARRSCFESSPPPTLDGLGLRPVAVGEPGPPRPRVRRVALRRAVGPSRGDDDPPPRLAGRGHPLPRRGPGPGLAGPRVGAKTSEARARAQMRVVDLAADGDVADGSASRSRRRRGVGRWTARPSGCAGRSDSSPTTAGCTCATGRRGSLIATLAEAPGRLSAAFIAGRPHRRRGRRTAGRARLRVFDSGRRRRRRRRTSTSPPALRPAAGPEVAPGRVVVSPSGRPVFAEAETLVVDVATRRSSSDSPGLLPARLCDRATSRRRCARRVPCTSSGARGPAGPHRLRDRRAEGRGRTRGAARASGSACAERLDHHVEGAAGGLDQQRDERLGLQAERRLERRAQAGARRRPPGSAGAGRRAPSGARRRGGRRGRSRRRTGRISTRRARATAAACSGVEVARAGHLEPLLEGGEAALDELGRRGRARRPAPARRGESPPAPRAPRATRGSPRG